MQPPARISFCHETGGTGWEGAGTQSGPGALQHLRGGAGPLWALVSLSGCLVGLRGPSVPTGALAKFSHQNTLLCPGTPAHQVSPAPAYPPVHSWPGRQGTQQVAPTACPEVLDYALGASVSLWYNGR